MSFRLEEKLSINQRQINEFIYWIKKNKAKETARLLSSSRRDFLSDFFFPKKNTRTFFLKNTPVLT